MAPPTGGRGGFRGGKGKPRTAAGFKSRGGAGGFKKSFDRPAPGGERKSFAPGGFKKGFDRAPKKEFDRSGPPGAFKKSYDRPGDTTFKKSYARADGSGPPGAFKKSYDRPEGGGFKKSFGRPDFKKSYGRPEAGGPPGAFKKSYDRPEGGFKKPGPSSFKKSYGDDRKPFVPGVKRPFDRTGGDRPGFARKPFDRPAGEERIKKYDRPGTKRDFVPRSPTVTETLTATVPANDGRWVWGVNPVLEALRAHPEQVERLYLVDGLVGSTAAAEILSRGRDAGLKVDYLERDRLTSMIGGGVHQGVVAEVREYQYKELEDLLELAKASGRPPLLVVLDGIQDPHNLGAIIRSAHSFGAHGVIVARDRAAGVTGMVAKSSAGAIEHCPVARVVNIGRALEQLKEGGFWTVAADPEGTQPAWEAKLDGPLAVVVGSEGPGVRDGVLSKCDFKVLIPMSGQVASLNASVSAGILLYEVSRQRAAVTAPSGD